MPKSFAGIYAIMVTPFTEDGSKVDVDGLHGLVESLIADGMRLLTPCGNTGEFHALSDSEKRLVAAATIEAAGARSDVVVGVGGPIPDVITQIRDCEAMGAAAIMVHYPPHPFMSDDGIVAYYQSVAASTSLPIIPYIRGTELSQDGALRIACLPNVVAMKYAVRNPVAFADLVAAARGRSEAAWICGVAESWAPSFWIGGADGFTSGLVNVTARHSIQLLQQLEAGDRAGALATWRLVRPFEQLRSLRGDGNNVSVVKEGMRQIGRPAGPARPPSSVLTPDDIAAVARVMASLV